MDHLEKAKENLSRTMTKRSEERQMEGQQMEAPETAIKTINDYKTDYEYFTGKASEINRNIALGGIAIIWIFRTSDTNKLMIPEALIPPLICLVMALAIDLLQYISGGLIWFIFFKYKESQLNKGTLKCNENIKAPAILPLFLHILYWLKILCTGVAYYLLIDYLTKIYFSL